MRGESKAEEVAREVISRLGGAFVSRRDGHVLVKLKDGDKTTIVWFRQRPITRQALELFKRIVGKHEYDKLVLVKMYSIADYVSFKDLEFFDEVKNVEEIRRELLEKRKSAEKKGIEKKMKNF